MNNNWENEPSLDYFELRRRHEEYKNSQRKAKEQPDAWEDAPEDAASQDEGYYNAEDQRAAAPQDIPEEADLDADAESYPADDNDAEDAPVDDNPNPFDSFISAFHGLRSRFGKRRKGDVADDEEYEDGDDSDAARERIPVGAAVAPARAPPACDLVGARPGLHRGTRRQAQREDRRRQVSGQRRAGGHGVGQPGPAAPAGRGQVRHRQPRRF